ncbi:MAG: nitrogen regulation protein NR(II), partial [Sandaracinaceae bacterium]
MDSLFAQAPVPLWVADFTAAAALLAHVSDDGHDAILAALRADPDLLAACGQAVRVVTANAAAAALMGFENGDTMHGPLGTMLPDTAMDALAGQIAAVLGGRTPFREEAIEVDQPDRRIVIELHLSLPDPSDWSRAIVATIDRTDHVKTEDRLRASEDRFRAICEHAPVMIDQFDADGKCVLWNHECERRLGWTLEEVRAHADPLTLFYPDEAERLRVIAAIQERDGAFREYSVLAKDGQSRTQMWADLRLPSGEQISVGYDTTEQRELEEQARQKQKLESLGLMAGGVAHDFNNLLVGVLANADLARMRRRHDTELCEMLDEVVDAAQRAAGLSRQLLAYSGGAAFTAVPIDLSALIEELAPMIAASAPSHATVRYDLEPDLSSVEGDPTQLTQVVFNLVLNACEALGEGADGVSVST